jgi:hypothetical protein
MGQLAVHTLPYAGLVTCVETAVCERVLGTGSDDEKSGNDKQYPSIESFELTGQLTSVFVHVVPESVHDESGHMFSTPEHVVPDNWSPGSHTN